MNRIAASIGLTGLLAGCVSPAPTVQTGHAELTVTLSVISAAGKTYAPNEIPRRPILIAKLPEAIDASKATAYLAPREAFDDAFVQDAKNPPLSATHARDAISITVERLATGLQIEPQAAQKPGSDLVLIVTAQSQEPVWFELHVSEAPELGANLDGSWPPDGCATVPASLREFVLHADGEVDTGPSGLALRKDTTGSIDYGAGRSVDCTKYGWAAGNCYVFAIPHPLAGGASYSIGTTERVTDGTGAPVTPWQSAFRTLALSSRRSTPTPLALPCNRDETEGFGGCVRVDDQNLYLRARFNQPVLAQLTYEHHEMVMRADQGEVNVQVAYDGGPNARARLRVTALDGTEATYTEEVSEARELPGVTILRVLGNPSGTEPDSEVVELWNSDSAPVNLGGYTISDTAEDEGDTIAEGTILPAHASALIVSPGYETRSAGLMPPRGTLVIRLESSIANSGLRNAGEPLFLRDPDGVRMSATPAVAFDEDGCIERINPSGRDDETLSFFVWAAGTCPIGRAPAAASALMTSRE